MNPQTVWSSVGSGPILVYLVIGLGLTIGAQILLLDEPRGPVYVDARRAAIDSYEHA